MSYVSYEPLPKVVTDTCAAHWNPPKTRCHGCPIMTACHTPVRPLTLETIAAHRALLTAAAEQVSAQTDSP